MLCTGIDAKRGRWGGCQPRWRSRGQKSRSNAKRMTPTALQPDCMSHRRPAHGQARNARDCHTRETRENTSETPHARERHTTHTKAAAPRTPRTKHKKKQAPIAKTHTARRACSPECQRGTAPGKARQSHRRAWREGQKQDKRARSAAGIANAEPTSTAAAQARAAKGTRRG